MQCSFGTVLDALETNCKDFSAASSLHGCLAIAHCLLLLGAISAPTLTPNPPLFLELPAKAFVDKVQLLPITHETIDRAAGTRWLKPGAKLLADLADLRAHQAKAAGEARAQANVDAAEARSAAVKARAFAGKKTESATKAAEASVRQRQAIESADVAAVAAEKIAASVEEHARKKPTPTNTQKAAAEAKLAADARATHRAEIRALKPLEEKAATTLKAQKEALSAAEKAEATAIVEEAAAETAAALEIKAIEDSKVAADDRGPCWSWYDDNGRNFGTTTKVASPNCSVTYGALNDRQRYCFSQILIALFQSREITDS